MSMDAEEKESSGRVRFNFWIPKATYDYLESVSIRDGRSMSDILREAVRHFQVRDAEEQKMIIHREQ